MILGNVIAVFVRIIKKHTESLCDTAGRVRLSECGTLLEGVPISERGNGEEPTSTQGQTACSVAEPFGTQTLPSSCKKIEIELKDVTVL